MIKQKMIEMIKQTFEKDEKVKICYKFQADKALQIQLHNGETFNICIVKVENKTLIIKEK